MSPTKLALALVSGLILTLLSTAKTNSAEGSSCIAIVHDQDSASIYSFEVLGLLMPNQPYSCFRQLKGYPIFGFLSAETTIEYTDNLGEDSIRLADSKISSRPYINYWIIPNILFWSLISWIIIAILSSTTSNKSKSKK